MSDPLSLTDVCAVVFQHTGRGNEPHGADAVATMFIESNFRPDAQCFNYRDPRDGKVKCAPDAAHATGGVLSVDRGICQFNNKSHPEVTDEQAFTPTKAIGAMFHVSHGFIDFHEWVGHQPSNPQWQRIRTLALQELNDAQKMAKGPSPITAALAAVGGAMYVPAAAGVGAVVDTAKATADALGAIGKFAGTLGERSTWVRIAEVLGGAALGLVALFLLRGDLMGAVVGAVPGVGGAVAKGAGGAAQAVRKVAK